MTPLASLKIPTFGITPLTTEAPTKGGLGGGTTGQLLGSVQQGQRLDVVVIPGQRCNAARTVRLLGPCTMGLAAVLSCWRIVANKECWQRRQMQCYKRTDEMSIFFYIFCNT